MLKLRSLLAVHCLLHILAGLSAALFGLTQLCSNTEWDFAWLLGVLARFWTDAVWPEILMWFFVVILSPVFAGTAKARAVQTAIVTQCCLFPSSLTCLIWKQLVQGIKYWLLHTDCTLQLPTLKQSHFIFPNKFLWCSLLDISSNGTSCRYAFAPWNVLLYSIQVLSIECIHSRLTIINYFSLESENGQCDMLVNLLDSSESSVCRYVHFPFSTHVIYCVQCGTLFSSVPVVINVIRHFFKCFTQFPFYCCPFFFHTAPKWCHCLKTTCMDSLWSSASEFGF